MCKMLRMKSGYEQFFFMGIYILVIASIMPETYEVNILSSMNFSHLSGQF